MGGTNPVATYVAPNNTSQSGSTYKGNIDGAFAVGQRFTDSFAPHAQAAPNMTVALDAGAIYSQATATLTEVAGQNSATITAPTTNPRIDRIVIDALTGVVQVVTGTEAASPVPPAIPAGKVPIARVALLTSTTVIANSIITDERALLMAPAAPVTPRNSAEMMAQWVMGAIVANGTFYFAYKARYAGTITALDSVTGNGSFTVAVKINGTNVTGLSAVAVTTSAATTNATGANTFNAGDTITGVVSSASGGPTGAVLNLNVTWNN